MKTDKEYPATHSMCTAWYFVDEEDKVAIFSFDDNGPIPDTVDQDIWVNELCFEKPVVVKDDIKYLNLTDDQVLNFVSALWKTSIPDDYYWNDDIFQIDTEKKEEFLMYLKDCRKKHGKAENWDNSFVPCTRSSNAKGFHSAEVLIIGILGKLCHNLFVRYIAQMFEHKQTHHQTDGLGRTSVVSTE